MKKIDPVTAILKQNAASDSERRAMKYAAMRQEPFVFFRGTCHLFYARLPELGDLMKAPTAWACGDLHLENFGSYKGDNGLTYFDVNDFDEALLAPCIWDMVRVVASITLARNGLSLGKKEIAKFAIAFVDAYAEALATGKPRWIERETATGIIGALLAGLKGKRRSQLIEERTVEKKSRRLIRTDGTHALTASDEDKAFARELLTEFAKAHPEHDFGKVLDVARRIAGTGSLGIERYVLLTRQKGGKGRLRLLDLKRAMPSTSVDKAGLDQPAFTSEAARVVTIQTLYQAASPAFLSPVETAAGRSFVLRALQPRADRLALDSIARNPTNLEDALTMMARTVAWGQLRMASRHGAAGADALMAFASETDWRKELLAAASECADRAVTDWQIYSKAYDEGAFGEKPQAAKTARGKADQAA